AMLGHSSNRLGNWHLNAEQPADALRCHHEALEIFETIGDWRGESSTLDLVAMTHAMIGDSTQSLHSYERAISLLRHRDDRKTLSSALASAALIAHGSWSSSTSTIRGIPASLSTDSGQPGEEAIRLAREIGWRSGEAFAASRAGTAMIRLGDVRAGFRYLWDALDIAERIQHRQWMALIQIDIGSNYLDMLLPELARQHLESGLRHADETGSALLRTAATGLLATALIQVGDDTTAEQLLQGKIDPARGPRLISEGVCWYAQALLLLDRQQPEHALRTVDRVIASIPAGPAALPSEWLRLRGEILLARGRHDEAEASLNDALTVVVTHRSTLVHWRMLASLRRLYLLTGRHDEATAAQDAGLALVNDLAAQIDDEVRQAFLTNARRVLDAPQPSAASGHTAGTNAAGLTARELDVLRHL
ncbi:MAG: tetratricopeptide repeat protein, partial [Vicinamibacterales bacterium]